ncbi:dipeptidase [Aquamicrobium segne]|uniref:Dipeptidase n=1 Tax=Aquamicrobium segne TaxID=469547 RepID=A0ABW0GWS1_9HYPH
MTETVPVFDGHNDTLMKLYQAREPDKVKLFVEGSPSDWHIDLPRAKKGGFAGGMFAVFPPPVGAMRTRVTMPALDEPLAAELDYGDALSSTMAMISILLRLARAEAFHLCTKASDIRQAIAQDRLAVVFHIEGAEAIGADLAELDLFHAAGLRSLGIVWSRPNIFGHGVPFRMNSTPDIGPGLTDAGKALVKACNELRIQIDLSHLNEQGFRDVASLSTAPLVATHSNVHALCPHARNLTAWQLGAICETGGMVGVNFATGFLREDGRMDPDTGLEVMVRHIDALIEALGEDHVGFGSDFDGATIPAAIGDVAGLPSLISALADKGYGRELIEKIAWKNWVNVLERTIG